MRTIQTMSRDLVRGRLPVLILVALIVTLCVPEPMQAGQTNVVSSTASTKHKHGKKGHRTHSRATSKTVTR